MEPISEGVEQVGTPDAEPADFRGRMEGRRAPGEPVGDNDAAADTDLVDASNADADYVDESELAAAPEDGFDEGDDQQDELFGMPREEFIEALTESGGVVPDALMDQLKVKITRDGMEETISLSDYRDSAMRQSDYSRKLNDLRGERQQFQQTQGAFAGMVDGWKKNPSSMADDLELLGIDIEAVLEPVASMYASEADMTPRERDLSRRAREAERRERMSRLRQRAEQQQLAGTKEEQSQARMEERVASMRTPAFAQSKITDGPTARRIFDDHLRAFWQSGDLTAKIALDAAGATREDLIRMAQEYQVGQRPTPGPLSGEPGAPPAQPARRAPPPRGVAPGGGNAAVSRKAGTVQDFRAHIEATRERRRA